MTEEDIFVHHTAVNKKEPRKCLCGVGVGEVMGFDVHEGESLRRQQMWQALEVELQDKAGKYATAAPNHYRCRPGRRGPPAVPARTAGRIRVGKGGRVGRALRGQEPSALQESARTWPQVQS
uniref:Y-box-binding protein 1-like n=1 Tax=Panthera onca TaxID=9690 RepID=UPI0029536990|nr:Y-box-binding protein 1-like [Panthera onca]